MPEQEIAGLSAERAVLAVAGVISGAALMLVLIWAALGLIW